MPRTAFRLTPTEERVLAMIGIGMNHAEIAAALGWHRAGTIISSATEKARIMRLKDMKPKNATSLLKARGRSGRASFPNKG